jgi:hypothetical protein
VIFYLKLSPLFLVGTLLYFWLIGLTDCDITKQINLAFRVVVMRRGCGFVVGASVSLVYGCVNVIPHKITR